MTRLFDAPRQLVAEALTDPEHVRNWWGDRVADDADVAVTAVLTNEHGRTRLTMTIRRAVDGNIGATPHRT